MSETIRVFDQEPAEGHRYIPGIDQHLWGVSQYTAEAVRIPEVQQTAVGDVIEKMAEYDPFTAEHMIRVGLAATLIARQLAANPRLAYMAGTVHDIGKVEVPLAVLNKPASEGFSYSDRKAVSRHSPAGYEILNRDYSHIFPAVIAKVAGTHHSLQPRNPNGVEGLELDADEDRLMRIVAIADADDARTTRTDGGYKGEGESLRAMTITDIERLLPDETDLSESLAADICDSIAILRSGYCDPSTLLT
jgi:hypothetical protein